MAKVLHTIPADIRLAEDQPAAIHCAGCNKLIWFRDSYSPPDTDEAICAECDTEITGRKHAPSIPVTPAGLNRLWEEMGPPKTGERRIPCT